MDAKVNRTQHWDGIYEKADDTKVGWYQPVPRHSLELIESLNLDKSARIIDVGAGNSSLVKELATREFTNLTALDISEQAIEIAKPRAGKYATQIHWMVDDVLQANLGDPYQLWHDRAVFHFLWEAAEISAYVRKVCDSVEKKGYFILGTFADDGPDKCSGLPVNQYSEEKMESTFGDYFEPMKFKRIVHHMPSGEPQNYLFGIFRRKVGSRQ